MAVNRFMTPAELPKVSFFQLPYDQMKEGIMSAQMQQDTAREGISQIGDISFNYLTNATNDVDLAKNIYGELYQKTQGILSKQGNGDLRGLRGEIYNLGKEVGRWYKPDGKIGRLQSNYLQFMDWLKRQNENKDLDKTYVNYMANKFIKDYDANGGAKAGNIYTEDLEKAPDVPKLIKDMEPLIKTTIKEKAYAMTNGKYMSEGKDAYEVLGPEKVRNVIAGYLSNSPDYYRFMTQAGRHEYFSKDQLPLVNPVEKEYTDKNGKKRKYIDYAVNDKNPYAASIYAAMEGLSRNDHKQDRHLKGDPYGEADYTKKINTPPMFPGTVDETIDDNSQETIAKLHKNFDGTPMQLTALVNAKQKQIKIGSKLIYDANGNMKPEYTKVFGNIKDKNGTVIDPNLIASAYILSSYDPKYNLGHGSWVDEEMFTKILEQDGRYKVTSSLTKDGLSAIWDGFTGLFSDGATDITKIREITADYMLGLPFSPNYGTTPKLQTAFRNNNKNAPAPKSQQTLAYTIPDKYPGYEHLQDPATLKNAAPSYNYIVVTGDDQGKSGNLYQYLEDKKIVSSVVKVLTDDPNGINPLEPQRQQLTLEILKNPKKPNDGTETVTIEIASKTAGPQNVAASSFSNALYNTDNYYGKLPVANKTGYQAGTYLQGSVRQTATDIDKRNKKEK